MRGDRRPAGRSWAELRRIAAGQRDRADPRGRPASGKLGPTGRPGRTGRVAFAQTDGAPSVRRGRGRRRGIRRRAAAGPWRRSSDRARVRLDSAEPTTRRKRSISRERAAAGRVGGLVGAPAGSGSTRLAGGKVPSARFARTGARARRPSARRRSPPGPSPADRRGGRRQLVGRADRPARRTRPRSGSPGGGPRPSRTGPYRRGQRQGVDRRRGRVESRASRRARRAARPARPRCPGDRRRRAAR